MNNWKKIKLKDVLKQYRNTHWVEDKHYKQVTISQTGEVSYRGTKHGSQIGRKRQFIIDLKNHPHTLIFIRQGVYNGGIGICPKEVDGCIVTENMPMFDIVGINSDYLLNYTQSPQFKAEVGQLVPTGTAQKAIHERQLLDVEIPLPSLKEQEEIVKKVKLASQGIKDVDFINTSNESCITKLRQSILQSAVQGTLVPQDPQDEPASELLKRVKIKKAKPYTQLTTEENNEQIPLKWVWVKFGNLVDFSKRYPMKRGPFGSSITKSIFVPKGENTFKVYEQKNAIYNDATLGHYYVNKNNFEKLKAFEVEGGDIIISCSGTIGKIGFLPEDTEKGIINQALLKLCINEDILLKRYFGFLFEAYMMKSEKLTDLKGTAMKNIPPVKVLQNMPIPLPPLSEQKRIVEKVDKLMAYCDELENQVKENQVNSEKLMSAVLKESF